MTTQVKGIMSVQESILPRILVADDQPDVLEALRLLLKTNGYRIETASSPGAILEALEKREFDLVLMDLNYARDTTSGREGLDLLSQAQAIADAPPIVVMTGWATVGLAVEAMQRGVRDFVEKPWVNTRLLDILRAQVDRGRIERAERRRVAEEKIHRVQVDRQLRRQLEEIEEAREIQQGFLPKEIPQFDGFAISGSWKPARVVGGDYFDVLRLEADSFAFCIADVAGKGMPAALLMSNLQATVRGMASHHLSPEELCEQANKFICRNIAADKFITFFYGVVEGRSRRLRYVNAGHNAPIVLHSDGSHYRLSEGGGVLGVFPKQSYLPGETELLAGDRVVLFTDGVTEAQNSDGEEFGETRLLELLSENRTRSARELQERILSVVIDFNTQDLQDDATLLVVAVE
jgi:phosphoserine phosphatase RsbU/P